MCCSLKAKFHEILIISLLNFTSASLRFSFRFFSWIQISALGGWVIFESTFSPRQLSTQLYFYARFTCFRMMKKAPAIIATFFRCSKMSMMANMSMVGTKKFYLRFFGNNESLFCGFVVSKIPNWAFSSTLNSYLCLLR